MASQPTAAAPAASKPVAKRSILRFFLRILLGGRRFLLTIPLLLLGGFVGWEFLVYEWYRGASTGERTGVIIKVSRKGTPFCRYESVEMRVGQQPGTLNVATDTWEFTVDAEHADLIGKLQEAERKQEPVTVQYRQDTTDLNAKPNAPPKNLPWRYCVGTSYHATNVIMK